MIQPVRSTLVLGGGTAGLLAAIAVRTHHPDVAVRLIRSPAIGIIGVGEGTTSVVPQLLHDRLQIDVAEFYREANPTWKLGIRYLWGPRDVFHYSFGRQMTGVLPDVAQPLGYFCGEACSSMGIETALMEHDRAFVRHPQFGFPLIGRSHAYHLENKTLTAYLEKVAVARGATIIDDTVAAVERGPEGVSALTIESGRREAADLYIDCSGFRSELLGAALGEPFVSFASTLFCDRACVGGWTRRAGEGIQPYTVAETMDAGWCWRIDHEHAVHRGYVYSSSFIDDDQAEAEFRAKNPQLEHARIVRFRSGRHERAWVKNVCAIGNAHGFVEPLEATAIAAICEAVVALTYALATNSGVLTESTRTRYNRHFSRYWDAIRRFLGVHYKYHTRLDTEFWRAARSSVDLAGAEEICDFYRENGPSMVWEQSLIDPVDQFGMEGYLTMLVGQRVPHESRYVPTQAETESVRQFRTHCRDEAARGCGVEEALRVVREPEWRWQGDFFSGDRSGSVPLPVVPRR